MLRRGQRRLHLVIFFGYFVAEFLRSQIFGDVFLMDVYAPLAALGKFAGYFARYGCDLALQISHPRLAGVVLDDFLQGGFVEGCFLGGQAVF